MPTTCEASPTTPILSALTGFQYVDEPLTGRTLDGENGHVGFVTVADLPYKGLVAAAREANQAVLRALERSFAASR
jgi:hypothetical protein